MTALSYSEELKKVNRIYNKTKGRNILKRLDKFEQETKQIFSKLDLTKLHNNGIKKISGILSCLYPGYFFLEKYNKNKFKLNSKLKSIDVYIHIPFCSRNCTFCAYEKETTKQFYKDYIKSLIKEIEFYKEFNYEIDHFDMGGGTPSQLELKDMNLVLKKLNECFKISSKSVLCVEVHPELIRQKNHKEYLHMLKDNNVSMINIGIQSFNNMILHDLNRGHTAEEAIKLVRLAKSIFKDVEVDLLYGFKGHSMSDWKKTIAKCIELDIDYIDAYMYIDLHKTQNSPLTEKEIISMQYFFIKSLLAFGWYLGGEGLISTEVRFQKYKKYFPRTDCLRMIGIGSGAYTCTDRYLAINFFNIAEYIKKVNQNGTGINLFKYRTYEEFIICAIIGNLLFTTKLDVNFFLEKFKIDISQKYKLILKKLMELKLISYRKTTNIYSLTKLGILYSSEIVALFLPSKFYKEYFNFYNKIYSNPYLEEYRKEILNSPFGFVLNQDNYELIKKNEFYI